MRNDSENSGLDGTIILAVIAGADVVIDRRTRTVHTFNERARDAVNDLDRLGMGMSSDNDQSLAFLRALVAQDFTLYGISPDGDLYRLVDKASETTTSDDEGG